MENERLVWRCWLRNGDCVMCEADSCAEDLNAMVYAIVRRKVVVTQFHVIGIKSSSLCVGFALYST